MTDTIATRAGSVTVRCYFDDQGATARGWYAEFTVRSPDGEVIRVDDSEKIWACQLPTNPRAHALARRRARGYARKLLADLARRSRKP